MTTDKALCRECRKLARCEKLCKPAECELVEAMVNGYEAACEISRKSNKDRATRWSDEAYDRGQELQRWFQTVTGRPWIDMPLITGKKQRYQ